MKLKKIASLACAFTLMASTFVMPASAATKAENFRVYLKGGAVVSSGVAKKENTRNYMAVTVQNRKNTKIKWVKTEKVLVRGRTSKGVKCTVLSSRNTPGNTICKYSKGYGKKGVNYKLAAQYNTSNKYKQLDLTCFWTP